MDTAQVQPAAPAVQPSRRRVLDDRLGERRAELVRLLTNPIIAAENPHTLTLRANSIDRAFKPRNDWQDWVTGTIATTMLRIDRCERVERKLREMASYRAIDFWEDDRAVAAETLALKLDKQPARTVAQLKATPAGLEWLLKRWRFLAGVAVADWTDAQRELAVNLAGADPIADPTAPGFAAAMVADLEGRREAVAEADALARGLVESDLNDDAVAGLAKLRRYVRSLHKQLRWYIDTFHVEHPDRWDDPMRQPAYIADDLITAQLTRRRRWPFNDPPAPRAEPTFAADPAAEAEVETGAGVAETEKCGTKPTVATENRATLASAVPEVVAGERLVVHDYSTEPGYESRRRRRSPMAIAAAKQARANRRRASKVLIESL